MSEEAQCSEPVKSRVSSVLFLCKNQDFLVVQEQRPKKVVSDSPGLVIFVLNLPDGQVLFFKEIQITEGLQSILVIKKGFGASRNDLWASTC